MDRVIQLLRNTYGGLSREIWILAISQFINRSGTMVIFFLALYLQKDIMLPEKRIGVVMACFGIGSFVGTFFGGRIADKLGNLPVMRWSMFLGSIMFIVVSLIHDFMLLCVGMFLLTAINDAFRPANMASISQFSTPQTFTRAVSINRLAVNLGFSFGPAIGGILAGYDFKYIFWADGLTCMVAFLIISVFLRNPMRRMQKERMLLNIDGAAVSSRLPHQDKKYLFFVVLTVFYVMAFFQLFSTMSLYYTSVEHLSEAEIGMLLALNGLLVAGIEMIMIYKLEKKASIYNFIAIGAFLLVISYVLLLFVHGWWWMALITVIVSFSEMFAMPFMQNFMNSRSDPSTKARYAALYIMGWSTGQSLIPIITTQFSAVSAYNALWIVLAGFALIFLVGIKILERWKDDPVI